MTANIATTSNNLPKLLKLSDTALIILSHAAQREDRLLLPVPSSITAPPEIVKKTIENLMAKSLVEERSAKLEDVIWRTDEQECHLTLSITDAGVAAIDGGKAVADGAPSEAASQVKDNAKPKRTTKPGKAKASRSTSKSSSKATTTLKPRGKINPQPLKTRDNTKANQILALLRRSHGATLVEMTRATGWQAHSIRGFLSGTVKKRMGLKLTTEQAEGKERRYKIPAKA